jgi:hypothetical protein
VEGGAAAAWVARDVVGAAHIRWSAAAELAEGLKSLEVEDVKPVLDFDKALRLQRA